MLSYFASCTITNNETNDEANKDTSSVDTNDENTSTNTNNDSTSTDMNEGSTSNDTNEDDTLTEADENISSEANKKVLLISIDGMRSDALLSSKYANRLIQKATYYTDASTIYPSLTLPCHMSMLHGVGPELPGVYSNQYTPSDNLSDGIAEVVAKSGKTCAFFYNWGPLGDTINDTALTERKYISGEALGWQRSNIDTALACKEYILTNDKKLVNH